MFLRKENNFLCGPDNQRRRSWCGAFGVVPL